MLDAYKYFMKNKPDGYYMSLNDFSNIVSRANSYLGDMFVKDVPQGADLLKAVDEVQ